jgi:hypothetical protein
MNTSNPAAATLRRNRTQMVLIAILFFVPILMSYVVFFFFPQWVPTHRLNRGQLVEPARAMPMLSLQALPSDDATPELFKGKWTLLQLGGASCDAGCEKHLYMSRQLRTRLNRDARRIQRVYVAPDLAALTALHDRLASQHPDLAWRADTGAPGQRLSDFLQPQDPNALYLVDPRGFWMMLYPGLADFDDYQKSTKQMEDEYKDMQKLLKLSQVD